MNIKLHNIQTVELVWPRAKKERRKDTSKTFGMVSTWKKKKRKNSQFVHGGGYKGINNMEWIDREERRTKIKALGTER